jgi:hypothetical protein
VRQAWRGAVTGPLANARLRDRGSVTAAVVKRDHLHVFVVAGAVDLFVFDAQVGEADLLVEMR